MKQYPLIMKEKERLEDPDPIHVKNPLEITVTSGGLCVDNDRLIEPRMGAEFDGRAVYLPGSYDYHLGQDSAGEKILVVTKKA